MIQREWKNDILKSFLLNNEWAFDHIFIILNKRFSAQKGWKTDSLRISLHIEIHRSKSWSFWLVLKGSQQPFRLVNLALMKCIDWLFLREACFIDLPFSIHSKTRLIANQIWIQSSQTFI